MTKLLLSKSEHRAISGLFGAMFMGPTADFGGDEPKTPETPQHALDSDGHRTTTPFIKKDHDTINLEIPEESSRAEKSQPPTTQRERDEAELSFSAHRQNRNEPRVQAGAQTPTYLEGPTPEPDTTQEKKAIEKSILNGIKDDTITAARPPIPTKISILKEKIGQEKYWLNPNPKILYKMWQHWDENSERQISISHYTEQDSVDQKAANYSKQEGLSGLDRSATTVAPAYISTFQYVLNEQDLQAFDRYSEGNSISQQ
jgi:hypothetical protein